MTGPATPLLEVTGLSRAFDGVPALQDVDLAVHRGESVVLIGESGSGKTLLLKCILGLIETDSGIIRIGGDDLAEMSGAEHEQAVRRVGMLFQRSALFDSLPVWENICFRPLQEKRLDRAGARDLAVEKLAMVGLDADVADLLPSELSGGMQKRVGLARAVADDPEILFLDEPTAGLDPIMSNVINDMIRQIVSDLGATVISIDSDMAGMRRIADRVVMLQQGAKVWDGPTADLDQSGNEDLATFIGSKPLPTLTERRAG
ncbi:MAG: ATP-binding cassette domain-containing protein [Rhodospirillales bacterium]